MKCILFITAMVLLLANGSCESAKPEPQPTAIIAAKPAKVEVPTTGARSITLPTIETELPPGPGKVTVISTCTLCHSQRYVLMQPNFPRKTWIAEVDKMKKVYGAPIQDEQVEPIVNYLTSIRGNGQ
jgi:cytochrome c5